MNKIDFIIIGPEKSATSFLQHCLAEHKDIFIWTRREVPWFQYPDYKRLNLKGELEKLFEESGRKKIVGIKRPAYLGKPESPRLIAKHFPKVKLFVVLRSPIDRAVSAYYHQMRFGFIPVLPINIGMELILNGKYRKKYPRSNEILEFGLYAKHLNRYYKYFDKEQVKLLFFEDVKDDPMDVLRNSFKFLGASVPRKRLSCLKQRPQKGMYSLPRIFLRSLANKMIFEYSSDGLRIDAKKLAWWEKALVKNIKLVDKVLFRRLFLSRKPVLSKQIKAKLIKYYQDDVQALEKIVGKRVRGWID